MVEKELREWSATNEGVGHAGEWETSVQLHLREYLIDQTRLASDDTGTQPFKGELACDRLEKLLREYRDLPVRHYREFGSHCTLKKPHHC